jgi:UDP-N-acetylmuramate dehydrogenase
MSEYENIANELKNIKGLKVLKGELLSKHTTFKIGGPAKILVIPSSIGALKELIVSTKGIPKYIIGNGSDLLVSDNGINGIVIKISKCLDGLSVNGTLVTAGAGTLTHQLLLKLASLGLSGLEFAAGIPAALGGAVVMNMGARGSDISNIVNSVEFMDPKGKISTVSRKDIQYAYRHSDLKDIIITGVTLTLKQKDKKEISSIIKDNLEWRKNAQPLNKPSAGSVFKNPKSAPAGLLIDRAGMKGMSLGGAEVSSKHANFIINKGHAKASEVKALIGKIKAKVKAKFGEKLEVELIDSSRLNMVN